MTVHKDVERLLAWAQRHSPRTKQLHRFVTDLLAACQADRENTQRLVQHMQSLQNDRNSLARIAQKAVQALLDEDEQGPYFELMTEQEYQLYTAACINLSVADKKVMDLQPSEAVVLLKEIAEEAFVQVAMLGCPQDVIEKMREHFLASLKVGTAEDVAIDDELAGSEAYS